MAKSGNSNGDKLMQAFFAPAVALMSRLNVARKFALLGLMSLAAMAVVVYSLFASLHQIIDSSQRELEGFALIGPLSRVEQNLQRHRGLSAGLLGGDEPMRDSRASTEQDVAKAFQALEAKFPPDLASGEDLRHIRADWKRLREMGPGWTAAENFAAHTRLIKRVRSFRGRLADDYALTLDPDINSYYLIDAIVHKLPHALEHLGQLRAYGTGILASAKQATPQQQFEINILAAKLHYSLEELKTSLGKAGNHNPALQNLISTVSRNIAASAQQTTGLVASQILAGHFAARPADFFRLSTAAIDQSYAQLHGALLPAAETLIKQRIARAQHTLYFSVGIATLLLLIVTYFSAGNSRAVITNIRSLARSAHALASGRLHERVELDARDEFGQIGESFNEMAIGFSALLEASCENEARLQDLSAHLEDRVKERTRELNVSNEHLQEEIAVRTHIANELKYSRDQYDRLTTNIPVGIYRLRTTAEGKLFFEYVSARFCAMLGVIAEAVYADADAPFQAIHPDDLAGFVKLNQVAIKTCEPFIWEGRTLVKGVTGWLRIESRPEPLDNGECLWDGVLVDIAARKLAQIELQHNQDLLNEAQRLGQLGSWELHPASGELRWSDEIYRIFELDPARFPPSHENFLNTIHPDDRDKVNQAYASSLENRQPYDMEHRLLFADGRIKWVHEHCTSEFDASGKPLRSVGAVQDITARKRAEEEIHQLAFYDPLTRLPNRRLFLDRFRAALATSARHNKLGALLFIDLDRFKLINDTFGHEYGDLLLVEVAARIKSCVREVDTVARLGGDEFVVLVEDISDDQAEAAHKTGLVAEKIRTALACPYHLNGHEYQSSPSIGVSLYRGNQETVEELLQHADMAMYQAKDAGCNAVRFFDPAMQHNVTARTALVNDLHGAIAERQLHLHYQLQVDNDNRPVGAEVLLRWIHPQRGMVMPERFLPLAEESALILDIDEWVLNAACRQLALWSGNEKTRKLVLTVNVSAKQFAMPDFAEKIAVALRTHQVNPARLKLELKESMALDDLPGAVEKMHALKALGVFLSMDDFGTRYSSLSSLKRLPLDQLKLSRNFVQDVTSDGNIALLVQSIIDMSSRCRISVIAEGVENEAQLTSLKDRDCVAYQGFLFSKAVPVEEFEKLLEL